MCLLNKNKQKFEVNKYTYQKEVCSGHPEFDVNDEPSVIAATQCHHRIDGKFSEGKKFWNANTT